MRITESYISSFEYQNVTYPSLPSQLCPIITENSFAGQKYIFILAVLRSFVCEIPGKPSTLLRNDAILSMTAMSSAVGEPLSM